VKLYLRLPIGDKRTVNAIVDDHLATLKGYIINTTYNSLAELGYAQAGTADTLLDQARFAIANIKGFPAEIDAESKAELYKGYQRRYNDTHPVEVYAVVNGHYLIATPEHIGNKSVEKINVGVHFAFSYSQQEFGKLKSTEPGKHEAIKKWRDDVNDYSSNRLGDLKKAAGKIIGKDKPRTRTTLDFVDSVNKAISGLEKSVKVKFSKGDTSANPAKFKSAVKAFWDAYNKA
jgi:hypothetical protein